MFFGQRKKKTLKAFWALYDEYMKTQKVELRPELSRLLSLIENPKDRDHQLLRPEIEWNKILAWQVLRRQKFVFHGMEFYLEEGEVLSVSTSIYVQFLSRVSSQFVMPGAILKPGYHLSNKDRGEISAHKWSHMVALNGLTDERGLYLPLYEHETVLKFLFLEAETIIERVVNFLKKEKGYVPVV